MNTILGKKPKMCLIGRIDSFLCIALTVALLIPANSLAASTKSQIYRVKSGGVARVWHVPNDLTDNYPKWNASSELPFSINKAVDVAQSYIEASYGVKGYTVWQISLQRGFTFDGNLFWFFVLQFTQPESDTNVEDPRARHVVVLFDGRVLEPQNQ